MPGWQKRLFLTLAHNAANPADYFGLPGPQHGPTTTCAPCAPCGRQVS